MPAKKTARTSSAGKSPKRESVIAAPIPPPAAPRKKPAGPPPPTAGEIARAQNTMRYESIAHRAERDLENQAKVREIGTTLAKVAEKRRATASASAPLPSMIAGGGQQDNLGRSDGDISAAIHACQREIRLLEADTAAIAVGDEMAVCSEHAGEGLVGFCLECNVAVCPVCVGLTHRQHRTTPLKDFIAGLEDNIKVVEQRNQATLAQLEALEAALPRDAANLHRYIDVSTDKLFAQLKLKGKELHEEVRSRQLQTLKATDAELRQCLDDLRRLQQGQLVLGALQAREGEFDFHAAKVVHAGLSFDEFTELVSPEIAVPPRLTDQLQLQLPMQSLKEVCELLTWTDTSLASQRQLFPIEEAGREKR